MDRLWLPTATAWQVWVKPAHTLPFTVEATVKIWDAKTVTEMAYWLLPGGVKGVAYGEVSDIEFTSAKTKMLDISLSFPQTPVVRSHSMKAVNVPEDKLVFCENVHGTDKRAGVLIFLSPFYDEYILTFHPAPLAHLLDENCFDMNYADLVAHCQGLVISVSEERPKQWTLPRGTRSAQTCGVILGLPG